VPQGATRPLTLGGTGFIGGHINPGVERFQGDIDEVRISSAARGADWIAATHLNTTGGLVAFEQAERY